MDKWESVERGVVTVDEYSSWYGCCGWTGLEPNTFCENGHLIATELSDHCSPVVQFHSDRVRMR